jgi:hypothetical protein
MRLDEYSQHIAYANRYKLRKRELIELVEYFMIRRICVLEDENQQLKELLLECSEFLYEILDGTRFKLSFKLESGIRKKDYMMSLNELITKTTNAIGEKNNGN